MFPVEWAAYLRFYGTGEEVDKALEKRFGEKPEAVQPETLDGKTLPLNKTFVVKVEEGRSP